MTHQQGSLGVCYRLLCTNLGDGVLFTLSPNHNIHGINGVYQRWTTCFEVKKCGVGNAFSRDLEIQIYYQYKKLNLQEKTAVNEIAWLLNIFLIIMSHKRLNWLSPYGMMWSCDYFKNCINKNDWLDCKIILRIREFE